MEFTIQHGDISLTVDILRRPYPRGDGWSRTFVEADVRASLLGFTAKCRGHIGLTDLIAFRSELQTVCETLNGSATLETIDPLLRLHLGVDHLGHILWDVLIVDPARALPAQLSFQFESDQTYLPSVLPQLDAILAAYPVMPPDA